MNTLSIVLIFLVSLLAAAVLRPAQTTVFEYERGLRFRRGRFQGVLGPGMYWHLAHLTRIQRIDVRPARVAVSGQEVLSADGVAVKASIAATYRVADPERAVLGSENYQAAIHTELQLALRAITSAAPIDELLRARSCRRGSRSTRRRACAPSGSTSRTPRCAISLFRAS